MTDTTVKTLTLKEQLLASRTNADALRKTMIELRAARAATVAKIKADAATMRAERAAAAAERATKRDAKTAAALAKVTKRNEVMAAKIARLQTVGTGLKASKKALTSPVTLTPQA